MSGSINLTQSSIALAQSIVLRGYYPGRMQGQADGTYLGMIVTTAFSPDVSQMPLYDLASGQTLSLNTSSAALYSIIGNAYGGNNIDLFKLPSLGGASIIGSGFSYAYGPMMADQIGVIEGSPYGTPITNANLPPSLGGQSIPLVNQQYGQNLQYLIQAEGLFPNGGSGIGPGTVGSIVSFAGPFQPGGFIPCDGRLLSIAAYEQLFELIGTIYGGDGIHNFAVPDLAGRIPVGTGGQYELGAMMGWPYLDLIPVSPDQANTDNIFIPVPTIQPSIALNFIISTDGLWRALESYEPTIGQIVMYAGEVIPDGWMLCEGQSLPIAEFEALYQLLGTNFGGDGVTHFKIPDLRDRSIVGTGGPLNLTMGQVIGQPSINVSLDDLPAIIVPIPGLSLQEDSGQSSDDHITNISEINIAGLWPNASVEYSKDGLVWSSTLQAVEGSNTIYARQIDYIGQRSTSSQAFTFILDTQAPSAPKVSLETGSLANNLGEGEQSASLTGLGSLVITDVEAGALLSYSIDGGTNWSDHFKAKSGLNVVHVRQTDIAGNVSLASTPISFEYIGSDTQNAQAIISPLPDGGHRIDLTSPGLLTNDAGTKFVDTVYFGLQSTLSLPSNIENVNLSGLGAGNTVLGNSLSNMFVVQGGHWRLDGRDGEDIVMMKGSYTDYRFGDGSAGASSEIKLLGREEQIILTDIESIIFDDAKFELKNDPITHDINLIYHAALERSPDAQGFRAWSLAQANGLSLLDLIDAFLASQEYFNRHGSAQSSHDYIEGLYQNILGRDPDAPGLTSWGLALDSGQISRSEVFVSILKSQEALGKEHSPYFILV